jgi:hypothetical protein
MLFRLFTIAVVFQTVFGLGPADLIKKWKVPKFELHRQVGAISFDVEVIIKDHPEDSVGHADFSIAVTIPNKKGEPTRVARRCANEEYMLEGNNLVFPAYDDEVPPCTRMFIEEFNAAMGKEIIRGGQIVLAFNPADRTLNVNIVAPVSIPYVGRV